MVLKEKVLVDDILQDYHKRRKEEAVSNWNKNVLHGEYSLQLQMWLERSPGDGSRMVILKKGTQGLILVAKEQALKKNLVKHSIDKTETPLNRLCGDYNETT